MLFFDVGYQKYIHTRTALSLDDIGMRLKGPPGSFTHCDRQHLVSPAGPLYKLTDSTMPKSITFLFPYSPFNVFKSFRMIMMKKMKKRMKKKRMIQMMIVLNIYDRSKQKYPRNSEVKKWKT